jgi:hypothetical protein
MRIIFLGDSLTEGNIGVSFLDILKEKLPKYDLVNYGRNGEPIVGLYHRMKRLDLDADAAFIWCGTNDIYVNVNWSFPIIKTFSNQPWAKNHEDFKTCYTKVIETLLGKVKKIFTVSLWFIGEDFNNKWNKESDKLSEVIKQISQGYNNVQYIDLREVFKSKFKLKRSSDYLVKSSSSGLFDFLTLKSKEEVDKKSTERGLEFTVDGVHLNSISAQIIADVFFVIINTNI